MKKSVFALLLCVFVTSFSWSQEWLTSFKFAKRLALMEDKMILAVWENSASYAYPVLIEDNKGIKYEVKLFEDENANKLVWEYFVPVIISESNYDQLAEDYLKDKSYQYKERFNDDFLKVMDPNGNIINTKALDEYGILNLTRLIRSHALNLSFLKSEMTGYFENKSFSSAFRLAVKYLDFATYAKDDVKKDIVNLSDIYMNEAKTLLEKSNFDNKSALTQKIELLDLNKDLILGRHRKVYRALKKTNETSIDKINKSLYAFLQYASLKGIGKIEESLKWQGQVTQNDLNKIKFLVK